MQKKPRQPNLFIIGAPKCGTSSMMEYLSAHPKVFCSKIKEPHYFNSDSNHRYCFSEKDYLRLFDGATADHFYQCEGSVWYLYSKVAIDEILKFNPDAKFIIMLRNPSEMYFSLHQEMLFGGSEDEKSPVKAWRLQKERNVGKHLPKGCTAKELLQYREVCSLGELANRAKDKIAQNNLIFVLLDDLKNDPNSTYLEVLNFLGLELISLPSYEIFNEAKTRRSYWLSNAFISVTRIKHKVGLRKGIGLAKKINKLNVTPKVSTNSEERKELKPVLIEAFHDDIALLERVIGKDLSRWKTPQAAV